MATNRDFWVDPPVGYLYGFPKLWKGSDVEINGDNIQKWLIENGYPEQVIREFGASFTVRLIPALKSPPEA